MGIQRIQIANNKKVTSVKHQKREISQLLADGKVEKARIKVEHIIRDDFIIEAYEILELLGELIFERIKQISNSKECPADLKQAVASLIWASSNVDIDELKEVKKQLTKKFGSKFAQCAELNKDNIVNPRLFNKLTYKAPSVTIVEGYLKEIASTYNVEYTPITLDAPADNTMPYPSPSGASIPMAPGSGIRTPYTAHPRPGPPPPALAQPPAMQPALLSHPPDNGLDPFEQAELAAFRRNQSVQPPIVSAELIPDDYPAPYSSSSSSSVQYGLPAVPMKGPDSAATDAGGSSGVSAYEFGLLQKANQELQEQLQQLRLQEQELLGAKDDKKPSADDDDSAGAVNKEDEGDTAASAPPAVDSYAALQARLAALQNISP